MDLAKLLRLRTKGPVQAEQAEAPWSQFLQRLAQTLRNDIAALTRVTPEDDWVRLARIMKVYSGNLNERADPTRDGTAYVFLNVPSQRGFMLEAAEDHKHIELRKGTLIVPLKRNAFEQLESSTLFVTSPALLGQYAVLDSETVRSKPQDRTITISMMSEYLLSLAFGLAEPEGASAVDDSQPQ